MATSINPTSPAAGALPKLEDFPEAEIIGGAVILDGKNMGTLMTTGEVEPSPFGTAYLAQPPDAQPLTPKPITEIPDPVPEGVFDPKEHEPVKAVAKKEVRRRKLNEVTIDAMNSPTDEEEANFKKADEAQAAGEKATTAGKASDAHATAPAPASSGTSPAVAAPQASPSSGAAQQPPASY